MLSFSNMLQYEKKNIVVSLVAAIIFFCLKIISKFILLFHEKRKDVYFSYLFFQIATPYIYIFSFFNNAKRLRGVPFLILFRIVFILFLDNQGSTYHFFIVYSHEKLLKYVKLRT